MIDSKGSNDHAIKIACYFGIDVNRPDDNYIYASVNQFTIGAIFRAFKLAEPRDIPRFVRESGFPEGITVAYSTKGTYSTDKNLLIHSFCSNTIS